MEPVTFLVQIDAKTYIKLAFKKVLLSNFTLMVYSFGIVLLYFSWLVVDMEHNALTILTIAVILILVIYPIHMYTRIVKASKATGGEATWKIDESGIEIIGQNAQGKYNWNFFSKITEDKEWVFLWYQTGRYTYFPKALLSPEYRREMKKRIYLNRKK